MTGGGLPHGAYANGLRSIDGVTEILQFLWEIDGRYVPGIPYLKTRQALLLSDGDKSALKYHRDNNIIEDSPQVYRIQCAVIQHPPAMDAFSRPGALLSIVAATAPIKRTMAEVFVTRDSQCECGRRGKGALDRPTPINVLCGPRMSPSKAKSSSMDDLLTYIRKHVDKQCYSDVPLALLASKNDDYSMFDKMLAEAVGRPITSVKQLHSAIDDGSEPRKVAIRAFMGGLTETDLNQSDLLSCTASASMCYSESRRTMDIKLIRQWLSGGKKGTKRPMTDGIQKSKVIRRLK